MNVGSTVRPLIRLALLAGVVAPSCLMPVAGPRGQQQSMYEEWLQPGWGPEPRRTLRHHG
jgi:hypothetical protein